MSPEKILCTWIQVDIATKVGSGTMVQFILQLGMILIAAHTSGSLFRHCLHLPYLLWDTLPRAF